MTTETKTTILETDNRARRYVKIETPYTDQEAAIILKNNPNDFAQSLLRDFYRYGPRLTNNRRVWLHKLAIDHENEATAREQARESGDEIGDHYKINELFDNAIENGLRYPKIRLLVESTGRTIVLSRAGDRARFPGSINVVDLDDKSIWYGRIHTNGNYETSRKNSLDNAGLDLLKEFANDPAGVAARHGKLTSRCCFCHMELTDDRSKDVGYGPVCAKKYSLPWG